MDHVLGHKSSLGKFNKAIIVLSIFFDHNTMRLEMNYRRKKVKKSTNIWRLNNVLLHSQEITEEVKMEIKRHVEKKNKKRQQKYYDPKPVGCSKSSIKMNIILLQETRSLK